METSPTDTSGREHRAVLDHVRDYLYLERVLSGVNSTSTISQLSEDCRGGREGDVTCTLPAFALVFDTGKRMIEAGLGSRCISPGQLVGKAQYKDPGF